MNLGDANVNLDFLKTLNIPILANWMETSTHMSRVCRDPTSTKNGMSMIHLSSHGTAPSQDRIKPRAYTIIILIISSYSHFFPDFQLFVATDLSNYCCFCFLLAVLSLLFCLARQLPSGTFVGVTVWTFQNHRKAHSCSTWTEMPEKYVIG